MLPVALATELLAAGLMWTPRPGDRFVVPNGEMAEEIFYISEMTIQVHSYRTGQVLGFNGTTEWALDSLQLTDAVWLPREDQLRDELGDRFVSLTRAPGGAGWLVTVMINGARREFADADAETAYGKAVWAVLNEEQPVPALPPQS